MSHISRRSFTDEFKREAVLLCETSGRSIREIAEDLGVGLSTLTRWKAQHVEADLLSGPHQDQVKELTRLRKENQSVDRMCKILKVSSSGYYAWKHRPPSNRQREDMVLLANIRSMFACSNQTYGSPRMHAELKDAGFNVGRHRVARLMRENGLKGFQKRHFKSTTNSNHAKYVAPNLLDQDFECEAPNQKWGVDISYIWTREGWLYLAIVVDFFSRKIVGWQTSDRLKQELPIIALEKAVTMRNPPAGLIHHSDRGSQYCAENYCKVLEKNKMYLSMSATGNCYDNAMTEAVFKTIKAELIWKTCFQTKEQANKALGRYIDGFYNPIRRHSALGYKSPINFEKHNDLVS